MNKSRDPDMNQRKQQWRVNAESTINRDPEPCVWLKRSRGMNEIEGFTCQRGTVNPNTCLAEVGKWGAIKFDKVILEWQQKLELMFGQMIGREQEHWNLSLI